jgi:hypothetical protein
MFVCKMNLQNRSASQVCVVAFWAACEPLGCKMVKTSCFWVLSPPPQKVSFLNFFLFLPCGALVFMPVAWVGVAWVGVAFMRCR